MLQKPDFYFEKRTKQPPMENIYVCNFIL
ncbi:MAG: hypothetical protein K6G09_10330 [Treponema sp.]|nr:hypothetical protein [Treponema sp.]